MYRTITLLLAATLVSACGGKDGDTGADDTGPGDIGPDSDGDGWADDEDCDPDDPWTHPGADDIPYDGKDNDCAGDGDLTDVDGDGYEGENGGGPDCNDNNPDIYPNGEELCLDGIDNDCDDTTSDNDCDGDGYDREAAGGEDCEDYDAERHPGVEEIWYDGVDQDCDGNDADRDEDGEESTVVGGTDCNDDDPIVNTAAEEICGDGIDNNCDSSANQCFHTGAFDLGDADAVIYGTALAAGEGLLGAGDLDGDGGDDLVIASASGASIWLLYGPITAETDVDAGVLLTGDPDEGPGLTMAAASDLDGDGDPDVAIGAPFGGGSSGGGGGPGGGTDDPDGPAIGGGGGRGGGGAATGLVYVIAGDTDGGPLSELAHIIEGIEEDSQFGAAVRTFRAGGQDQLLVGAPLAGKSLDGEVYVLAGDADSAEDATATFLGNFNNGYSGATLGTPSDIDGDGTLDFVIGAPNANTGAGGVLVFYGPAEEFRSMNDFDSYVIPVGDADQLGAAVDSPGDMNADGYADIIIGAPGESSNGAGAGMVYVVNGPPESYVASNKADHQLAGEAAGDAAGAAVAGVGDLDGDGTIEAMAGSPGARKGAAYLVMGPAEGFSLLSEGQAWWGGLNQGDAAGASLSGADINGDGLKDMLIGAPGDDTLADDGGAVYLVFGQGI
jgi:hypothetical protein